MSDNVNEGMWIWETTGALLSGYIHWYQGQPDNEEAFYNETLCDYGLCLLCLVGHSEKRRLAGNLPTAFSIFSIFAYFYCSIYNIALTTHKKKYNLTREVLIHELEDEEKKSRNLASLDRFPIIIRVISRTIKH